MFVAWRYFLWTNGNISGSTTMALSPTRRYLVTGALSGRGGGDYGQVYISTLCTQRGDQVLCGVRDVPPGSPADSIAHLGITEFVQSATRVTVKLRANGGLHRAEGVIYDIT